MTEQIIIAGAGGQGIMLLGKILAEAAMRENKFITCLPSYGAEVRGGAAHCMVIISDKEIGSPYIEKADSLIIMNTISFEKFKNRIKKNGLLILNSPKYPFTDMALALGNIRVANMIALGCYLAEKKTVRIKKIIQVMEEIAPADKKYLVEINKKALFSGVALVGQNLGGR